MLRTLDRFTRREMALWLLLVFLVTPPWAGGAAPQQDQLAAKSQQGREALQAGRFEEAVSIYTEIVRALPNHPGMLMNLGLAHHLAGRPHQALDRFRTALELAPDMVEGWFLLGAVHLELGQFSQAVEPLSRAVRLQPDHREGRQMLADALLRLERYDGAVEQLRELARLEPDDPRTWYGLGRSYESLSQEAFEKLQETSPDSPYWFALVGDTLFRQGRFSNAFFFYRRALDRKADLRGLHRSLAEIYRKLDHPEWADAEEEKEKGIPQPDCASRGPECEFRAGRHAEAAALARAAKSDEAYYWLVRAYNELALEAYARLGRLPPSAELHQLKAEIHSGQGRHREAVQELEEALKLSPGAGEIKRRLAEALYRTRDHEAAQRLLQELLRLDSGAPDLNFLYGDSLLQAEEASKALPFLKRAVQADPEMLVARASLGRAHLQLGETQEALPHLKKALEIDEDGSLHYQLARAYQTLGQADRARETLQRYQEIQRSLEEEKAQLEEEMQITPPQ